MEKVRVLIVEDSALVREILVRALSLDPGIEVVGTATGLLAAREKIGRLKPDVLILDVEMPGTDGGEFLRRIMAEQPLPVVVLSAPTGRGTAATFAALEAGAFDSVTTPGLDIVRGLNAMLHEVREKVKTAATAWLGSGRGIKGSRRPGETWTTQPRPPAR